MLYRLSRWANYFQCRFCRPVDYWHNRDFDARYQARAKSWGEWEVLWNKIPVPVHSLQQLTQTAHSDTCHIIASGPSLSTISDPARLFDEFTICVNGSYKIAVQTGRQCDFLVVSDRGFITRRLADYSAGVRASKNILVNHLMLYYILKNAPELTRQVPVYLYENPNRPFQTTVSDRRKQIEQRFAAGRDFISQSTRPAVLISKHAALGLAENQTVVCSALQLAWLMGFKQVRIFGMDLGGNGRFYSEGKQKEPSFLEKDFATHLLPWFTAFSQELCGPAFQVWNHSPASRLPAEILPKLAPDNF